MTVDFIDYAILRRPSPRHCSRLLSKKCCGGGEPLATLRPISTSDLLLQRRTRYRSTYSEYNERFDAILQTRISHAALAKVKKLSLVGDAI